MNKIKMNTFFNTPAWQQSKEMQQADTDTSFVIGPDDIMRTRGEHVRVFQRWLTGPGMTPVMTEEELNSWKADMARGAQQE